jgi:hypothetical protein
VPIYIKLIEHRYGLRLSGVVVEIVKKPVTPRRQKGKEPLQSWIARCWEDYKKDPKRYYLRTHVRRDELDIDHALEQVQRVAAMVRLCDEQGYPEIRGEYCDGKYGPCGYKPLCWYGLREQYEHRPYSFDGQENKSGAEEKKPETDWCPLEQGGQGQGQELPAQGSN